MSRRFQWVWMTVLTVICLAMSSSPFAQDLANCVEEIQSACAGMEDHLENCLPARATRMSAECRAQLQSAISLAESPDGPGVCVADVERVCPGMMGDALAGCINSKRSSLSSECQAYLQSGGKP